MRSYIQWIFYSFLCIVFVSRYRISVDNTCCETLFGEYYINFCFWNFTCLHFIWIRGLSTDRFSRPPKTWAVDRCVCHNRLKLFFFHNQKYFSWIINLVINEVNQHTGPRWQLYSSYNHCHASCQWSKVSKVYVLNSPNPERIYFDFFLGYLHSGNNSRFFSEPFVQRFVEHFNDRLVVRFIEAMDFKIPCLLRNGSHKKIVIYFFLFILSICSDP